MRSPSVRAPEIPATMQAAYLAARGGPAQIVVGAAPVPHPDDDDVLVAVHSASITPSELDWVPTWTHPDGSDRAPTIPSHEVAGVVAAVGPAVTDLEVGSRVLGLTDFFRDGAAAEFVLVRAADLAAWPLPLSAAEAAALPLSGLTAWQALFDHGHLLAGEHVLIHGAAGGVGSFAVQLAHLEGAHVTAVVSTRDIEFVRELGADVVIDRRTEAFHERLSSVDLVIDTIGGEVLERSWSTLATGGRIVSVAPSAREITDRDARGTFFIVTPDREELEELAGLVERGELRVIVERAFSLDEARQAYEFGQREHPRGKVVLQVRA